MDKNLISKTELQDALCDVRKAHRLLFEYQNRIINLVSYIKDKYAMTEMSGEKMFSNPIKAKRGQYAPLQIFSSMWAWDFLYSYMFEFYLGKPERNNKYFSFSVIQVSDTGFFESQEKSKYKQDIQTFLDPDKSSSLLIFVFESIKNKNSLFHWNDTNVLEEEVNNFLESGETEYLKPTNDNNYFVLRKYKIEDFLDNVSTDLILSQFDKRIEGLTGINLLKKEE